MRECSIYVETSLKWPKKGNGIVGIVFVDQEELSDDKSLFGVVKDSTEHKAILYGIKNALSYCSRYDSIVIHVSCGYVASGFKWLASWKQKDYKTAKGEPVKFSDLWQDIAKAIENKKINIQLNEFNGYRRWLQSECENRGRKHGFIL